MTFWQVSAELATTPAVIETTALEVRELDLDAAALLDEGESVTAATCQLTDLTTNEVVGGGAATVAGDVATYVVRNLTAGHDYRLHWLLTVSANKKVARLTICRCVA